ncbi:MAG: nucleotide exchange factor GrpE [Clostridiales bacterium]|nr:nucleotide exchange factor GrpE [Candidatus Crickella caballi]
MIDIKDSDEMTAEELAEHLRKKEAEKKADEEAKAAKAEEDNAEASKADKGTEEAEIPDDAEKGEAEAKPEETEEKPEAESERYMRLMAEFQNFKKRAAKEKSDIHAYANEKIVNDLLPVLDNFERALEASPADDAEAYAKGMSLIFEQMKTALGNAGVKEIEALGETFDPNLHNAVMMEESEEHESGKVSKVLQKGYTINDKVVRPSMVAVSK